jgi:hypothetical protein
MLPGFSGHLLSEQYLEDRLDCDSRDLADRRRSARQALAAWRRTTAALGPASSVRGVFDVGAEPFLAALGFGHARNVEAADGTVVATICTEGGPVVLIVAGWGQRFEPLWRLSMKEAARRSAPCCILFNGTHIRLIDAAGRCGRRHVEFDLDLALDDERTFAALWMVAGCAHGSGSHGGPSFSELVVTSDGHASAVCRSLRKGVLEATAHILQALMARPPLPPSGAAFEQALTVVYRILFLLFAEARRLVPMWHPVYRDNYSLDALRSAVERERTGAGFWDTLRAISRMAHGGCRVGTLRVNAFNGRLFASVRTPLAERLDLDDGAARAAVLALSTRPSPRRGGRERISYRDLGVEQLGAVYETLLDYEPQVAPGARVGPGARSAWRRTGRGDTATVRSVRSESWARQRKGVVVSLEPGSGLRKATGTFYTPQALAQYLVRRTLAPLVQGASPETILDLRVLDPAMGSGAFLVAACGFLAEAYVEALVRAGRCHPSDIGAAELAAIRRTIAERCLYGVDLNPMAVQLARLSLWLATLSADRPLSFFDHHLQVGDSLIGAWVGSLARLPPVNRGLRRPADLPLFADTAVASAIQEALPVRFALGCEPTDTLQQVRTKERSLAALKQPGTPLSKWRRVANLWCAPWFRTPGNHAVPASAFADLSDAVLTGRRALPPRLATQYMELAEAAAAERRFFHWELEFPEVFFDASGARLARPGFDAIMGNPPWDMVRADSGTTVSKRVERDQTAAVLRFTRDSGVYTSQSDGHANRYQLFVERSVSLARAGGRLGLVLPWGLASDHGNRGLRRMLFRECDVDAIVGFDNRRGVFPIHRSVRFALVTATAGRPTREILCRLGEQDQSALERAPHGTDVPDSNDSNGVPWFPVRVTPALLARLSGDDDQALPELRSPVDVAIAERAATLFPALGSSDGWNARFGRELNATDDRGAFGAPGSGLPVVEGKLLAPFSVNVSAARASISRKEAARRLGSRHERPRLAYRDVASATNRQTLIAAILPPNCVSTHTLFCLRTPLARRAQYFLCGLFNSFVVNYLVRLRVTTHVTTAIVERLPLPTERAAPRAFRELAAIARLLTRRSDGRASARLNARVAALYQLTRDEFAHVLETFPLVPREQRDAALAAFDKPSGG